MSRFVMRSLAIFAAAGFLGACSSMPEWTKPTAWYDGVTGADKPAEAKSEAESPKTEVANTVSSSPVIDPLEPEPTGPRIKVSDKPTEFPNLATQPGARESSTTDSQRREIRDSLVADRDRAQHTADELRGGTAPAAAPPPPAPPKPVTAEEKPKDE